MGPFSIKARVFHVIKNIQKIFFVPVIDFLSLSHWIRNLLQGRRQRFSLSRRPQSPHLILHILLLPQPLSPPSKPLPPPPGFRIGCLLPLRSCIAPAHSSSSPFSSSSSSAAAVAASIRQPRGLEKREEEKLENNKREMIPRGKVFPSTKLVREFGAYCNDKMKHFLGGSEYSHRERAA